MSLYPDHRSAVLPALRAAQREHGWLSPQAMLQVAAVMRVTPAYLESIASFYDMLELRARRPAHDLRLHEHLVPAARRRTTCWSALRRRPARRVERLQPRRRVPPALVRVPGRLRHRADGLDRGPLPRPADARGRAQRSPSTCAPAAAPSDVLPEQAATSATTAARRRGRARDDTASDPLQAHRRAGPAAARGLRAARRLPRRCARR